MLPILSFVHITDTHLGPTSDYGFHGLNPAAHLRRLVELINAFPAQPDFVLHTGDLANDASAAAYAIAQPILANLKAPLYLVNGNHDDRALLRDYFGAAAPPHPSGDPCAPLDYTFDVNGERFLVLDGHNPDEARDPLGKLRPDQIKWVRAEATPAGPPLTVVLHYPLFAMSSPWLNENMLLLNGEKLHAALLPARDRLRGVFLGHLHRNCQIMRNGITYTCAGSSVSQYSWHPWQAKPEVDHNFAPAYNVVEYYADYITVQQYGFARP